MGTTLGERIFVIARLFADKRSWFDLMFSIK
jgi:hypothetical protein